MSKEELQDRGWKITYSGECPVARWGKFMVCVRHPLKGAAHGYGADEQQCLAEIGDMLLNRKEEIVNDKVGH